VRRKSGAGRTLGASSDGLRRHAANIRHCSAKFDDPNGKCFIAGKSHTPAIGTYAVEH
jgi:hypothetical protein